jgi:hypothetical protein
VANKKAEQPDPVLRKATLGLPRRRMPVVKGTRRKRKKRRKRKEVKNKL